LRRLIRAPAHAALDNEFPHAECEAFRGSVPIVSTCYVPNLKHRLASWPEGIGGHRCAFPEFGTAHLANHRLFPERGPFYLMYIFNQEIVDAFLSCQR
jgi:hypothetical protein